MRLPLDMPLMGRQRSRGRDRVLPGREEGWSEWRLPFGSCPRSVR